MDLQDRDTTVEPVYDGNFTDYFNKTLVDEEWETLEKLLVLETYVKYLAYVAAVLSLVTCVLAFITWINIQKWRTFRNFVYLNLIFCYTALYIWFIFPFSSVFDFLVLIFIDSFTCWLFIASVVSYMDIVKVFSVNVPRKRLKSSLFAWGMPSLISLISVILDTTRLVDSKFLVMSIFSILLIIFVLFGNLVIYTKVLCGLFKVIRFINKRRYKQKVQVATFTFLMSGSMMLPGVIFFSIPIFTKTQAFLHFIVPLFLIIMQTITINVLFMMLKSNRRIWRQYCWKRTDTVLEPSDCIELH